LLIPIIIIVNSGCGGWGCGVGGCGGGGGILFRKI
jgi:hypothetical protein